MKTIVEAGIAKFPAGRSPDEASAEAEAAYGRAPTDEVIHVGKSMSLAEVNALELAPGEEHKLVMAIQSVPEGANNQETTT